MKEPGTTTFSGIRIEADGKIVIDDAEMSAEDFKAVLNIPDTDQGDSETIWNDNGVLKVSGAG